jgi:hypothetical protein
MSIELSIKRFNKWEEMEGDNMLSNLFKGKKIILVSILIFILVSTITYFIWDVADVLNNKQKNEEQKLGGSNDKKELNQKELNKEEIRNKELSQLIKIKEKEFRDKLREREYQLQSNWTLKPRLIFKTNYKKCGDTIREEKEFDFKIDVGDLASRYSDWQLIKKNEKEVIFRQELNKVCPEHRDKMYLGVKDGVVAIFYGDLKDENKILKHKTNISVELLPKREINNLEQGIKVSSQNELLTLLEGLASIQDEKIE